MKEREMKEAIEYLILNLKIGEGKSTEELCKFASEVSYKEGTLEMFEGRVLYASQEFGVSEVLKPELVVCFALHTLFDRRVDPNIWKDESKLTDYIYDKTKEDIQVCVTEDGWTTEQVIELLEKIS